VTYWDELTEDVAQITRLRAAGRIADANFVLAELKQAFVGHPTLRGMEIAWPSSVAVPEIVVDRRTESILVYRPQVARRRLRSCTAYSPG
jgi:hypothetical protein